MIHYTVRTGSVLALVLLLAGGIASAAQGPTLTFEGQRISFARLLPQSEGSRAVAIDDPGIQTLLRALGATYTWQPGERYVLVTTAEPAVISFRIGDPRYDVGPVSEQAPFAPFLQNGRPYVPFDELLRALDLAMKSDGSQTVLVPQLASIDVESSGGGSRLVAHGAIPLDAHVVSENGDTIVIAFDGVGSSLPPERTLDGGPIRRIAVATQGDADHPRTIVTLDLAPGTHHTPPGTDDQRDFTIGFNGAGAAQPIAANAPASEPLETPATPPPSPQAPAAQQNIAQVTSVQLQQQQNGGVAVRIAVQGNALYEWHRLRPPDNRFWIDVEGARLAMPATTQPGSDVVSAIRVRAQNEQTVRIALSLTNFQNVAVVPDATGVTIAVDGSVADLQTAARSGSGSIGDSAAAYAAPANGQPWKFASRPAPPQQSHYVASNPRLIVIDPGHGGSDVGSYRGDAVEKTLTLDMSKRLRDILVARGWQVVMTRNDDRDVYAPNDDADDELQARDDIANLKGARLMVSIHVNAFINAGPHGATVYYYKGSDFALAQAVDRRIAMEAGIKDDGVIREKFYVIHHAAMPATLVETAFVSNPDDRVLLQSPQWRQKMARAIADGISDFAGPPPAASVSRQ